MAKPRKQPPKAPSFESIVMLSGVIVISAFLYSAMPNNSWRLAAPAPALRSMAKKTSISPPGSGGTTDGWSNEEKSRVRSQLRSDILHSMDMVVDAAVDSSGIEPAAAKSVRSFLQTFMQTIVVRHEEVHLTPNSELDLTSSWVQALRHHHSTTRSLLVHMAQEKVTLDAMKTAAASALREGECALCMLHAAVEDLRVNEGAYEYQNAAKSEIANQAAAGNFDETNFVYGTTPYPTWLRLFSTPPLQAATQLASSTNRPIVVLGSSNGWIPLYATLTFGIPSVGVEYLQYRHDVAVKVTDAHVKGSLRSKMDIQQGDALKTDITAASIVYMTSLAWTEDLVLQMHQKLVTELAEDTVVVANSFNRTIISEALASQFYMLAEVKLQTSWKEDQTFYMYKKRSATGTAPKMYSEEALPALSEQAGYPYVLEALNSTIHSAMSHARALQISLQHLDPIQENQIPPEKLDFLAQTIAAFGNSAIEEHKVRNGVIAPKEDSATPVDSAGSGPQPSAESLQKTHDICSDQWISSYMKTKEDDTLRGELQPLLDQSADLRKCFAQLDKIHARETKA